MNRGPREVIKPHLEECGDPEGWARCSGSGEKTEMSKFQRAAWISDGASRPNCFPSQTENRRQSKDLQGREKTCKENGNL